MNKFSLVAVAALALGSTQVMAGAATSNFDVTVSLTTLCQVKTPSAGLAFSYTAFAAAAVPATATSVVFECTRGFTNPPTVVLDSGVDATTAAAGQGTTGAGVVGGLQYTIAVAAGSKTAGTGATTGGIGTPDQYSYAITGSMASGQAGDASKTTSQTRTLTLAY